MIEGYREYFTLSDEDVLIFISSQERTFGLRPKR